MLNNQEVRFEVTNRCGYECVMCPREKHTRSQGYMSMDLFKKSFNEARNLGMKMASLENFGEAFLDPTFIEKVKYAKETFPEIYLATITTGGVLDKKTCDQLIDYEFNKIRFSFYGMTPETYSKIHKVNENYYFRALENIEYLISEKQRLNSQFPIIEVYFLELEENKHELNLFKEKFIDYADEVSIWKPHNWSDGRSYRNIEREKRSCGRHKQGPLQIQWDGLIVPCCFDYNSRIILGDVKEKSLKEILNGKLYSDFREAHENKEFYKYPFCDSCDQLYDNDEALIFSTIKNSQYGASNTNQKILNKG